MPPAPQRPCADVQPTPERDEPRAELGTGVRRCAACLDYVVEPGDFDVLVGTSSVGLTEVGRVTVTADAAGRPPGKAFDGSVTIT
jgi:hypothetical protein